MKHLSKPMKLQENLCKPVQHLEQKNGKNMHLSLYRYFRKGFDKHLLAAETEVGIKYLS
jgi:hypothetical protein